MNKNTIRFHQFQEVYPKANVTAKQFGYARLVFECENERFAEISDAKAVMSIVYRKKEKPAYDVEKSKAFWQSVNHAERFTTEMINPNHDIGYNHFWDND